MKSNHLTYFKVENFKKFDSLEVNDIGQFNLIVGDNNVGKTCFLESLLFNDSNLRWIHNLHQTLYVRGIDLTAHLINSSNADFPKNSFFNYLVQDNGKSLSLEFVKLDNVKETLSISYVNKNDLKDKDFEKRKDKFEFKHIEHWLKFYRNGIFDELQFMFLDNIEIADFYFPFIQFNLSYSNDIDDFINILENKREENEKKINSFTFNHKKELIKILNEIFNFEIIDYTTIHNDDFGMIGIATKSNEQYIAITQFGDGFNKIFRYIVEIMYINERGESRIMIDEVDTGIHYSKLKEFWINIIKISKKLNVQLFATTHSKECIEAYILAAKEVNFEDDIRLIELKDYNSKIYANTLNYQSIMTSIDSKIELRGGNIFDND